MQGALTFLSLKNEDEKVLLGYPLSFKNKSSISIAILESELYSGSARYG